MEVFILDRNVGIIPDQRANIERCIEFAFDRFTSHIRIVEVTFNDVNGPKGGEDLQCRMKIVLDGKGELLVEGRGAVVEAVVAETADRAALAVSRRLDRLRNTKGSSMSGQ
jgi:putative sigma-54 modulation protein